MKKPLLNTIILLSILAFSSCKKDNPIAPAGNLISNPFFDSAGHQSMQGWTTGYKNSFSTDVPPGGSPWSLDLQPQWGFYGFAETYVTGFNGTRTFTLSCYTKLSSNEGYGTISLWQRKQNGSVVILATDTIRNHNWQNTNLTSTVTLLPTDEIVVHLFGGFSQLMVWDVLFNSVYLQMQ